MVRVESEEMPKCRSGQAPIRPDVVLFDEYLDDRVLDAAYEAGTKCDLMLAIGSSGLATLRYRNVQERFTSAPGAKELSSSGIAPDFEGSTTPTAGCDPGAGIVMDAEEIALRPRWQAGDILMLV